MNNILHRPILGGAFGEGIYSLATRVRVEHGLHMLDYFVLDPRAGTVLSSGTNKIDTLARARHALRATTPAANDECWLQAELFPVEPVPPPPALRVSRRRREVFDRSGGRCCYCDTELVLAGPWHVEHQLPRALGGDDRPLNLVASCVHCNLQKGDRTALEFIVEPPR